MNNNFDAMLEAFEQEKIKLVGNYDYNNLVSFLKNTNACLRNPNKNFFNLSLTESKYSCERCTQLAEIFYDFFENKNDSTLYNDSVTIPKNIIRHYKYEIHIKKEEFVFLNENRGKKIIKSEDSEYFKYFWAQTPCGGKKYSGNVDLFPLHVWLNGVYINWVLENIFEKLNLYHVPKMISAFVCSDQGFKILRKNYEPLFQKNLLTLQEAIGILYQIAAIWEILGEYNFIHGSFTMDKLYYVREEINYVTPKGHTIYSPVTLIIDGFNFSSININPRQRVLPDDAGRDVDLSLALQQFNPIIHAKKNEDDTSVYCTKYGSAYLFTVMRYSGFPLFGGSYDIYSILVSLYSWCPFRNILSKSKKLQKVWFGMFGNNKKNIPQISELNITCSYKVGNVLGDKELFCDAVGIFMNLLNEFV